MSTYWTAPSRMSIGTPRPSPLEPTRGTPSQLRAGASRLCITPPLGRPLAGYPQRHERSDSIHDDVHVRALVFEMEGTKHALLSLDVMAVDSVWVDDLRTRAELTLGIPRDNLLVAATHTHSGPGELLTFGGPLGPALAALFADSEGAFDAITFEYVLRQALSALTLADASLQPARMHVGRDCVDGVASNRVDPSLPVDNECVAMVFEGENGPIATLIHFACHPSVLGDQDTGISADFPGVVSEIVERSIGGVALYLNGALGDVSTRFSRRGHAYSEAVRFGRMIAGTTLRALGGAHAVERPRIHSKISTIELPPKDLGLVAGAKERAASVREQLALAESNGTQHGRVRQLKTALQGAEIAIALEPRLASLSAVAVSVQRFDFADSLALIAFPAEIFSALGARLVKALSGTTILTVGPANGYLGYIPTEDAFGGTGYEADTCIVDRGAGELLVARVLEQLG